MVHPFAKPRRAPKARRERVSGADESSLSEVPMPASRAGKAREAGAIEAAGAAVPRRDPLRGRLAPRNDTDLLVR